MILIKSLLVLNLLAFQTSFTCEQNDQIKPEKHYTKEQIVKIRNQIQDDPEYQKKINEIKEQLLRVLGNQVRRAINSRSEKQTPELEN